MDLCARTNLLLTVLSSELLELEPYDDLTAAFPFALLTIFLVDFFLSPAPLNPFLLIDSLDFLPPTFLLVTVSVTSGLISILIVVSSSEIMIGSSCEPEPTCEGREGPGTP